MSRTVAILYGFCEGPGRGRHFQRALQQNGLTLTKNTADADIIIAHSSGCFLIPDETKAKIIMLVGVPYHKRGILWAQSRNVAEDYRFEWRGSPLALLSALFWNGIYFWRMGRNIAMLQAMRSGKLWSTTANLKIVHNEQDWFTADLPFTRPYPVISLPGAHDNLWQNPQPYVDIVKS